MRNNVKKYIIKKIEELYFHAKKQISIKYAYDKILDFHIIEISPSIIRKVNEFAKMENIFWEEFHNKFPLEDILISSPKPTNDMSNIIYEKKNLIIPEQISYPISKQTAPLVSE
jgi:hypothetical protein